MDVVFVLYFVVHSSVHLGVLEWENVVIVYHPHPEDQGGGSGGGGGCDQYSYPWNRIIHDRSQKEIKEKGEYQHHQ